MTRLGVYKQGVDGGPILWINKLFHLVNRGKEPAGQPGQCKVFAVRSRITPASRLPVIGLLPNQTCVIVRHGSVSVVRKITAADTTGILIIYKAIAIVILTIAADWVTRGCLLQSWMNRGIVVIAVQLGVCTGDRSRVSVSVTVVVHAISTVAAAIVITRHIAGSTSEYWKKSEKKNHSKVMLSHGIPPCQAG